MVSASGLSSKEEAALGAYVKTLRKQFGSRLVDVLLFGSKARNEAHSGSDVDVAVILRGASAEELSEVRGLPFDIWLAHGVFLSVRAMSEEGWQDLDRLQSLFYRQLRRDGVSLLPQA